MADEPRAASHPTDFEECIGDCGLMREGSKIPITIYVMLHKAPPHLKYVDQHMNTVALTPRDRKNSTLVMEDDTPERIAALRAALKLDRWANVVERG